VISSAALVYRHGVTSAGPRMSADMVLLEVGAGRPRKALRFQGRLRICGYVATESPSSIGQEFAALTLEPGLVLRQCLHDHGASADPC
jgi:hypothetical protein